MKRHICAVAAVLALALAGAGTATAGGLPVVGGPELDLQSVSLGDQSVGEQTNQADVTQEQGNGNVNISPAISILGDASTQNAQGNGNTAVAVVDQSNETSQSQSVEQDQAPTDGSAGCCGGGGQEATQVAEGGDQSVGEQTNDAAVTQEQGNGNVNISPAIAIGGDASTSNEQGNANTAVAVVDQANAVYQSQDVSQSQSTSDTSACCGAQSQSGTEKVSGGDQSVGEQTNRADVTQKQGNDNVNRSPAIALGGRNDGCGPCSKSKGGHADASTVNAQGNGNKAVVLVGQDNTASQTQDVRQKQALSSCSTGCAESKPAKHDCCGGPSQAGTQRVRGGDQSVGKQKNEADVTQSQGNDNVNHSPAKAFGGGGSSASTWNAQGNGNDAVAGVWQGNSVTQSQSTWQRQSLIDACKEVMRW